jgi:hypothetical protein
MKTELKEKMMDVALEHIYKVNADPDVKLEDVDAYDAWIKYDEDWDLNVHEANFGMLGMVEYLMGEDSPECDEKDSSKFEWYACAYPVRKGEDGYDHIITEEGEHLFKWEKKGKVTFITDQ